MVVLKNKFIYLLLVSYLLTGCTVTTTSEGKKMGILPLVADQNRYLAVDGSKLTKQEKLEIYANQLQQFYPDAEFVWLNSIPFWNYKTIDRFTPIPFMLYNFNGHPVRSIENNLFSTQSLYMHQYAIYGNKVPTGTHTLEFRNGYNNSISYTKIENVVFESGKQYAIGREIVSKGVATVFIAEYEADTRFSSLEPEYYIIKKKIIEGIEPGNMKHVKTY